MASKRSSNAANRNGRQLSRQGARSAGQRGKAASQPLRGSVHGDILGVFIAVLAVAMVVSLVVPTTAPVTASVGAFLRMLFGAGALLFPFALFVFAMTFFIDVDEAISARVAAGLALIVVAILSLISLNAEGAMNNPNMVLLQTNVVGLGGYVGGGVAWCLLKSVGVWVGNVFLAGVILTGVIVCGFSISGAVTAVREHAADVRENYLDTIEQRREARALRDSERRERQEARRASRLANREAASQRSRYAEETYAPAMDYEPATTYVGSRKSSVLKRGKGTAGEAQDNGGLSFGKILLRRHPDIDVETAQPASEVIEVQDALFDQTSFDDGYDDGLPWDDQFDDIEQVADAKPTNAGLDEDADGDGVPDFLQKSKRNRAKTRTEAGRAAQKAPAVPKTKRRKPASRPKVLERPGDGDTTYELPPLSMLSSNPNSAQTASTRSELEETKARLQDTLREFGLSSRVVDYISGPIVTTFRIEMGEGERVSRIKNLEDDIALTLAAEKVRIFAPIAGTSFVGIEIPNKNRSNVHLGDVLPYAKGGPLEVAVGRDSAGRPVIADISKMPHMLVAGTTGSGKSVMINSMIMSILMRATPKQVRLIMIDPKRVEFGGYNGLPHLYVPVVTEPRQAASALQWAVSEMERRLKVFERAGARNIGVYNEMCVSGKLAEMDNPPEPMPFLVIIIDELSDLMMVAGKDVEASIVRIAQLARAAGIHLVVATQRPSANVVTGLIKSNIDSRVALKVSSGIDSRVILDETGAERLLGNGDMLFKDRGLAPKRVLGCYASDPEIESVVDFIRAQGEPDYHEEILSAVVPGMPSSGGAGASDVGDDDDPLIWEAAQIVVESQLGSTSGLQRRLKVGYARAGRIMDMLEAKGVVGPPDGSKPREVLLDMDGLEELRLLDAQYREV